MEKLQISFVIEIAFLKMILELGGGKKSLFFQNISIVCDTNFTINPVMNFFEMVLQAHQSREFRIVLFAVRDRALKLLDALANFLDVLVVVVNSVLEG